MFKNKIITGLAYSLTADGLVFVGEAEQGYAAMGDSWFAGKSITVKCMERGTTTPYLEGKCVITSLERTDPANEEASYSINLENDGAQTTFNKAIPAS